MAELARPVQGTSTLAPAAPVVDQRRQRGFLITLFLLVVCGIASLTVAEQILTGWLALGERANISRRDLNFLEIFTMIGTFIWGMLCIWTAYGLTSNRFVTMETYFRDRHSRAAPGVLLTVALLIIIGLLSLAVAEQVATGWIALGERINISRRDINYLEFSTIILGLVWGAISLRTVYGLWVHDRRAWKWAQWVTLITALIGAGVLVSGLTDLQTVLPRGTTILDNLPGVQQMTAPGLLIMLSALVAYRFLALDADMSAGTVIRNRLSEIPGAGAIVGFVVIAAFFAISTDLFLEPRSLSGILATNITRGIVAIGITFLMISGEFDLSVGSVYGAGALVFLLMMTEGIPVATLIAVPAVVVGITLIALGRSGRIPLLIAGIILLGVALAAPAISQEILITSVIPAMLIALAFAAILGYINGAILITTGIPSFIVTLGTLLMYRAILLVVVADGRILRYADYRLPPPYVYFDRLVLAIGALILALGVLYAGFQIARGALAALRERLARYAQDVDDPFRDFNIFLGAVRLIIAVVTAGGAVYLLLLAAIDQFNRRVDNPILEISFFDLANGRFDFVPPDVNLRIGVMWWMILVVVFQFILTQTTYGNHVFAVGGNPGAARAQGINVNRVKILNFMICSTLAATAGIINVARLANVDPLMGNGLELEVIAASVIGGALLTGGYGSIFGALLGVLIFGMLQTGLVLIGVDARAFSGVIGLIIIVAVVINTAVKRVRT